jgi:histone deacetylase 6
MKRAAGGAVEAVRQLFSIDPASGRALGRSITDSSFAIVRPPGHHCCSDPNGFCFFNNTAIAASHARKVLGLPRVAIVDWDYHHGDGQQQLFYKDPTVLTISTHVAAEINKKGKPEIAFPANRGMDLTYNGAEQGLGYNINIPWPHDKVGAPEYQAALRSIVLPALQSFDPDLILVASGFDAVKGDTLAGTRLPPRSYYDMTRQLLSLRKPVAVILEGGYSPELLAKGSANVVHALLGRAPPCVDEDSSTSSSTSEAEECADIQTRGILDAVRCRLNTLPPWKGQNRTGSEPFFQEEKSSLPTEALEAAENLSKLIQEEAQKA